MRVMRVIKAVAAFHAQTFAIGRAIAAVDEQNFVVFDVVRELATNATERAHRFDLLVRHGECRVTRGHQRTGRARLHALAAGDAGGRAHRVVHIEHNLRVRAAEGEADDIVNLLVATGAQATCALNASVKID